MLKKTIFFILIFVISSCDFLNKPEPLNAVKSANGLNNIGDFESVLTGSYNSLQNVATYYLMPNDFIADDVKWNGSFVAFTQIANQDMSANSGVAQVMWNYSYRIINGANILIANKDQLKDSPQSEVNNIEGQALFLRALAYSYLVQYYAKPWGATPDNSQMGVPLVLKQVISSDDFVDKKRSSVKAVYTQIFKDLKKANGLIKNDSPARATNDAVKALWARNALLQKDWMAADTLSREVISNHKLNDDVINYFQNELSSEAIFSIENTITDGGSVDDRFEFSGNGITQYYNLKARNNALISDAYKAALKNIITTEQETDLQPSQSAVDTRVTNLLTTAAEPPLMINDYTNTFKYEDDVNGADNLPIFRQSEMILTRAEALAELDGVNQESIDLLNKIRTRAINVKMTNGATGNENLIEFKLNDFSNKRELIDAIFLERRVELSFEGHFKTDLQRRHLDVKGTPWDSDKLVFPIPQSQIDASSKIKQNSGY